MINPRVTFARHVAYRVMTACAAIALMNCGQADPTAITALSSDPYASLRLNTHTIVMSTVAPYDTLQLTSTAYLSSGTRLATLQKPIFVPTDTLVTVSATGLIHARYPTSGSRIIVMLQDSVSNITHVDTALVIVTDQPPPAQLASLKILRAPGDSGKIGVGNAYPVDTVQLVALDRDGQNILPRLTVYFSTSDPNTLTIRQRGTRTFVTGKKLGSAFINVSTTYYGVTQSDSIRLQVGNPVFALVKVTPAWSSTGKRIRVFTPSSLVVGVGATVQFSVEGYFVPPPILPYDVVFDNPSAATASPLPASITGADQGTGNIGPVHIPPSDSVYAVCSSDSAAYGHCISARAFRTPGVYRYHSALYGSTGTIIVKAP